MIALYILLFFKVVNMMHSYFSVEGLLLLTSVALPFFLTCTFGWLHITLTSLASLSPPCVPHHGCLYHMYLSVSINHLHSFSYFSEEGKCEHETDEWDWCYGCIDGRSFTDTNIHILHNREATWFSSHFHKESRYMGDPCVLWFTAFLRYTSSGGGDAAAPWGEEQDDWEEDSAGPPDYPGKEQTQLWAHWTPWPHGYQGQENQCLTEKGILQP